MAMIRVKTKKGMVEGLRCDNSRISVFKGIPYAKPPVGAFRWKAPQPMENWDGVLKADSYRAMPVQYIRSGQIGAEYDEEYNYGVNIWPASEDCLYLSVWTPAKTADEKLPVAVWVYGGAYKTGSMTNCLINGEAFAKRGCVFVCFNYRVGPLGYFVHPELSAENERGISGNYGTLDQICALQWVHDNIEAFGGDASRVTLIGQSAGAHAVMTLCNSPLTEGLFQQAIIQSTAGLSAMYYQDEQTMEEAEEESVQLLGVLGVENVQQARELDAFEITKKLVHVKISTKAPWFPKTDGYVLKKGTISSIMANEQRKIPYLCGSNCDETGNMIGFLSKDPARITGFAKQCFANDVDGYLATVHATTPEEVEQAVYEQYNCDKLCALIGWQRLEIQRGGMNFYQYYYTQPQPETDFGACHAAELPYVFQTLQNDWRDYTGEDYDLSNTICAYWTNFIKKGNPNGDGLPVWGKYSAQNEKLMELGAHVGMIDVPWNEHRKFIVDYMVKEALKKMNDNYASKIS